MISFCLTQVVPCQSLLQPASGESHLYLQHLRSLAFSCYSQCRRLLPQQMHIKSLTGFGPVSTVNSVLKSPDVSIKVQRLNWLIYIPSCLYSFTFLSSSSIQAPCSCTVPPSSLVQPVPSSQNKGRYGLRSLPNTTCSLLDTVYHMTSAGSWCPAPTSRGSSWRPASSTLMYPAGVENIAFFVFLIVPLGRNACCMRWQSLRVSLISFYASEHGDPRFQPGKWDCRSYGNGVLASFRWPHCHGGLWLVDWGDLGTGS